MKMMSMGSMFSGILRRLKRVRETKATLASRMLSGEERTKVAKEARATTNGAEVHRKVVKAFGGDIALFTMSFTSLSNIWVDKKQGGRRDRHFEELTIAQEETTKAGQYMYIYVKPEATIYETRRVLIIWSYSYFSEALQTSLKNSCF